MPKYYQAVELTEEPYLVFNLVAKDDTEYVERDLEHKANIFRDDEIPVFDYDICLSQLDGAGGLEPRIESQVTKAIADYNTKLSNIEISAKFKELMDKDSEISTLTRLGEDTAAAETEFNDLKTEWNDLKNA